MRKNKEKFEEVWDVIKLPVMGRKSKITAIQSWGLGKGYFKQTNEQKPSKGLFC